MGKASIKVDSLFEGIDFSTSLTRARFEGLYQDLFRLMLEPAENTIRNSKFDSNFFNSKEPNKSINPDIAYSGTVQAAILSGDTSEQTTEILLLDVAPLSFGIETAGGIMTPLITLREIRFINTIFILFFILFQF